jgi:tyrosyl-tRNA synthetase
MEIDNVIQSAVFVSDKAELLDRIQKKGSLRIKVGFDPTQPDLHLGHTVLMQKMRQLQDMGHHIILLIGDFTARIGDPTGRNILRPSLTKEQVDSAAKTYQEQAFKVLDRDKTEVRFNSEWLDKLTAQKLVELTSKYTVSRLLERNDFAARFAANKPISMHEFLYPLFQGFDSVMLDADLEMGGSDQLFNLMVGRDLMTRYSKPAQSIVTFPLLEGTNAKLDGDGKVVGEKMSKSLGNHIAITASPREMFQQLMLLDDGVIWRFMSLLSNLTIVEQKDLQEKLSSGEASIVQIKEQFAQEIVTRFHSATLANEVLVERRAISQGSFPSDAPQVQLTGSNMIGKVLFLANLASSGAEGSRLVKGGAVTLNGAQEKNDKLVLSTGIFEVRVGNKNKKFARITIV